MYEYAIQLTYPDEPSYVDGSWDTDEAYQRRRYANAVQGTKRAKVELLRRPIGTAEVVEANQ